MNSLRVVDFSPHCYGWLMALCAGTEPFRNPRRDLKIYYAACHRQCIGDSNAKVNLNIHFGSLADCKKKCHKFGNAAKRWRGKKHKRGKEDKAAAAAVHADGLNKHKDGLLRPTGVRKLLILFYGASSIWRGREWVLLCERETRDDSAISGPLANGCTNIYIKFYCHSLSCSFSFFHLRTMLSFFMA